MVESQSSDVLHHKKPKSVDGKKDHHKSSKGKKQIENGLEKIDAIDNTQVIGSESTDKKKKKKKRQENEAEETLAAAKSPSPSAIDAIMDNVEQTNESGKKKKKSKKEHVNTSSIAEDGLTSSNKRKEPEKEKEVSEVEQPEKKKRKNKKKEVVEEDTSSQVENAAATSSSAPITDAKKKGKVQDQLDAMLASQAIAQPPSATKVHRSRTSANRGEGSGGNRKVDKDYFLHTLDNTLTHEDMLVKELFYYNQLRWLEEERGLKIRKGPFDSREEKIIQGALDEFKKECGMNDDTFNDFVLGKRDDNADAERYSKLWQTVTGRLTGRPNRSVRTHVRRHLRNYVFKTGPWTEEEQKILEKSVNESGMAWAAISKIINRSPEHCRLRWRDYKGDGTLERQKGKWSQEEDEKLKVSVAEMEEDPNETEVTQAFWDDICTKMSGARSGRQCELRWKILNPKDGNAVFYSQTSDGPTLLQGLAEQADNAENDNFHDINLTKLLEGKPNWTIKIIKRAWRSMVARYIIKDGESALDPYSDFRARLKKIREAIGAGEEKKENVEKKKKKKQKKKANNSKYEDTVDSDNEIDNITQTNESKSSEINKVDENAKGTPKSVETTAAKEKSKSKKKESSKKKHKSTKDNNESDDSIG